MKNHTASHICSELEEMSRMEIADTFMNALGRGKDPEEKLPSISFVIGARKEDYAMTKLRSQGMTKLRKCGVLVGIWVWVVFF